MLENNKLFSLEKAIEFRNRLKAEKFVLTNGCFDLLHAGHIYSLKQAARFGNLWIALNSDDSVRKLKGKTRPIVNENERAYILSALECVSGIFIFNNQRLYKEIELLHPDVYVKSEDYKLESLDELELIALKKINAEIKFVSRLTGFSTTNTIKKLSGSNF